ncbi:MAG TPA: RNA polymerase sigma factor [Blastocatellia bacterium]|nr:RNA polymerase sigma factor [Blastocatellia bacterium]
MRSQGNSGPDPGLALGRGRKGLDAVPLNLPSLDTPSLDGSALDGSVVEARDLLRDGPVLDLHGGSQSASVERLNAVEALESNLESEEINGLDKAAPNGAVRAGGPFAARPKFRSRYPERLLDQPGDDALVRQSIDGDEDAFGVLVKRHSPKVFGLISGFFHRRDVVEDIAQEVFVKSYISLHTYTLGRSFDAWLGRITINACYDYLRSQRRQGEQFLPQNAEMENDWLDLQMVQTAFSHHRSLERQREASDLASRLLQKLDPEDRIVVVLMDRDGFSVKEISDITGWGPSKVKVRVFRARRTLRSAMKRLMTASERKRRMPNNEQHTE